MRIISLVPSLTELLYDLGLEQAVIGRTRFCVHPAGKVEQATIVGGTKNPNIPRIEKMRPDLVLCSREENRKDDVRRIEQLTAAKMLITDIKTIDQALAAIIEIGEATGRADEASALAEKIRAERPAPGAYEPLPAAYMIWQNPLISVGGDTYIHDVMREFGLQNVFSNRRRYPETSLGELSGNAAEGSATQEALTETPRYLLLSSEPYPFKQKHVQAFNEPLSGTGIRAILVDGEHFSWYGSRMLHAFKALRTWRERL